MTGKVAVCQFLCPLFGQHKKKKNLSGRTFGVNQRLLENVSVSLITLCHVSGHSIVHCALFDILWHFLFRALNTKIMSSTLYPPSAVLQKNITLVFKNLKVSMKTKTIIIKCNNTRVD